LATPSTSASFMTASSKTARCRLARCASMSRPGSRRRRSFRAARERPNRRVLPHTVGSEPQQ
jgi:hypothetical protein